jgi:CRISPR type IV-associated protein Csf3
MTSENSSTDYANLRVRAYLRAPVVADQWLPLDGVLLYQQTRADRGQQVLTTPGLSSLAEPKGGPLRGGALPLKRVHGKDWYYRCSWAQWGPHADGQDYWNKRFDQGFADLIDFQGRRGRVIIEQSTYKAYHMPVYYRSALWVEWYCVGDMAAVRELLACATHLGKKASQGWGRVARWEIEPVSEDWSIWRDGKLMRGIPPGDIPKDGSPVDLRFGRYGLRPSYWDRRNQMELVLP